MTLLPTTRLAYWTGIFLWPWTTMMIPIVTKKKRRIMNTPRSIPWPVFVPIGPKKNW